MRQLSPLYFCLPTWQLFVWRWAGRLRRPGYLALILQPYRHSGGD